jgi:hypothetical protein
MIRALIVALTIDGAAFENVFALLSEETHVTEASATVP